MDDDKNKTIWVDSEIIEAIESFPLNRTVEHCGSEFVTSPFEIYANCPKCSAHIKLRSFSASHEIEDVFDAIFLWLNRPEALEIAKERLKKIIEFEGEE